jgi:hypothetical protein
LLVPLSGHLGRCLEGKRKKPSNKLVHASFHRANAVKTG